MSVFLSCWQSQGTAQTKACLALCTTGLQQTENSLPHLASPRYLQHCLHIPGLYLKVADVFCLQHPGLSAEIKDMLQTQRDSGAARMGSIVASLMHGLISAKKPDLSGSSCSERTRAPAMPGASAGASQAGPQGVHQAASISVLTLFFLADHMSWLCPLGCTRRRSHPWTPSAPRGCA